MSCALCGTGFCWLCGEEIQDAEGLPMHFMRWNSASPCAGKQFEGMDGDTDAFGAIQLSCCERSIQMSIVLVIFFILLPFLLAACLIGCLTNCFMEFGLRPWVSDGDTRLRYRTNCQYGLVFLVVAPGLLACAVLWVPWFCYLRWKVQQQMQQNVVQAQDDDGFDPAVMQTVRQESVEEEEQAAQRRQTYGSIVSNTEDPEDLENPYHSVMHESSPPEEEPLIPSANNKQLLD